LGHIANEKSYAKIKDWCSISNMLVDVQHNLVEMRIKLLARFICSRLPQKTVAVEWSLSSHRQLVEFLIGVVSRKQSVELL